MLMVTEAAGEMLVELLKDAEAPDGVTAMFVRDDDGELSLTLADASSGDVVFEHAGTDVLVLDEDVSEALDCSVLDVEETDDGPLLVLGELEDEPGSESESETENNAGAGELET